MRDDHELLNSATSSTFLGRLTSVLGAMGATLSVLSVVLYLIVRSGYDSFYGGFGVTPEEAGIGQAEMISHAALSLGYLTLLLLLFVIPWLVPVRQTSAWWAWLCVALLLFAIALLTSLRERNQIGLGSTLGFFSISYLYRAGVLYMKYDKERSGKPRKPGFLQRFRRSGFAAPVLSLALVVAVYGAVSLQEQLSRSGDITMEAARGEPSPTWLGLILSIRARPVDVIWLGDVKAPSELKDLDRPLYLKRFAPSRDRVVAYQRDRPQ